MWPAFKGGALRAPDGLTQPAKNLAEGDAGILVGVISERHFIRRTAI
jgi:hypothetical protein